MPVAKVAASTAGDNQVVAAQTGKKVRVYRFSLFNGAATAQSAKWRSGTTDLTGLMYSAAALGPFASDRSDEFLFETAAGEALNLNLTAATAVGGYVIYELE